MIKAEIIADSINEFGDRLTTFVLTYPRIIHAEVMTHRLFSRNAASSRAIPSKKLIESVMTDPFIPIAFQKEHKGMQGIEYLPADKQEKSKIEWLKGRDRAVRTTKSLLKLKATKQLANRGLETYQYYTAIVSATNFENFFHLRCPQYEINVDGIPTTFRSKNDANLFLEEQIPTDDFFTWASINKGMAEIHIMALAETMWDSYNESIPKKLSKGQWHIPFGDNINLPPTIPIDEGYTLEEGIAQRKIKIAVARCARISYTVVGDEGKEPNYTNDILLHDRLAKSGHWSCFEHCAKVTGSEEWSGNFKGFLQYRKTFQNECK